MNFSKHLYIFVGNFDFPFTDILLYTLLPKSLKMVQVLTKLAQQMVRKDVFHKYLPQGQHINLDNKNCNPLLLWLTIYTHHLPHLTFYFDRRWDLEWHFCHKLQLRKWLHGVNLFFVLVTKCSFEMREIKRKHVLMWGVKKT